MALLVVIVAMAACGGSAPRPSAPDPNDGIIDVAETRQALARLGKEIPLPPGGNWDEVIRFRSGSIEEPGFVDMLAYNASCQWYRYWLDAFEENDQRRLKQAQRVVNEIPDWPWFLEDGHVIFREIAKETRLGGSDTLRQQLEINC